MSQKAKRGFLVCPIDASCKTLEKYESIKLLYEGNKYNKCENGQMLLFEIYHTVLTVLNSYFMLKQKPKKFVK